MVPIILSCTDNPYIIDVDQNGLLAFTEKNILFVNAMIHYDSRYGPAEDPNNVTVYSGMLTKNGIPEEFESIKSVVDSIDKINSTHLASEGPNNTKTDTQSLSSKEDNEKNNQGREKTANRIYEIVKNGRFSERLKEGDPSLVSEIARVTEASKNNFSFATKYCAFVSLFSCNADQYCIYDNVLMQIIPYYAYMYVDSDFYRKYCKRTGKSNLDELIRKKCYYHEYRNLIDEILKGITVQTGLSLSYRTLDKLLWYYYKGAPDKIKTAEKILMAQLKK